MKVYVAMAYREYDPECLGVFSSKENAIKSIEQDYEIQWSDYLKETWQGP